MVWPSRSCPRLTADDLGDTLVPPARIRVTMIPMKRGLPFGSLAFVLLAAAIIGCGGSDGTIPTDTLSGDTGGATGSTGVGTTAGTTGQYPDKPVENPTVLAVDLTFSDAEGSNVETARLTEVRDFSDYRENESEEGFTMINLHHIDVVSRHLLVHVPITLQMGQRYAYVPASEEEEGPALGYFESAHDEAGNLSAQREWNAESGTVRVVARTESDVTVAFESIRFSPGGTYYKNVAEGKFTMSGTVRLRLRTADEDANRTRLSRSTWETRGFRRTTGP